MINRKKQETTETKKLIEEVASEMVIRDPDSESFGTMLDRLERLHKLQEKKQRPSPDTLAIVVGNLAGILLILNHERLHPIPSKALNFVLKLK